MKTIILMERGLTFFLLLFFINSTTIFAQDYDYYYLEVKEGYDLGEVSKTITPDQTLILSMGNTEIATILNQKVVFDFKKVTSVSLTPRLLRVYLLVLETGEIVSDLILREEIEKVTLLESIELADEPVHNYENDYIEILYDNLPNTVLEQIKGPLAWTVTQGDPNVLIGVIDTKFDLNHEDLQSQIVLNLDDNTWDNRTHGTGVASLAAAATNNGLGMASIGYRSKLVTADFYGSMALRALQIAQIPGVKVINLSAHSGCTFNPEDDAIYRDIELLYDVLVVSSAGNSSYC